MEFYELVKIKPGTILYARLQHTILQRDTFDLLLCDIQELCLKVKSVILSPSRKHCVYIEILFDPIPLNRQIKIKSTTIQRIWIAIISNSEISMEGVIEWEEDDKEHHSTVPILSIENEFYFD